MKYMLLRGVAVTALLGMSSSVLAQVELEKSGRLGDIIVTARRTSENIQDVPVSVTAVTSDVINQLNISDISSIPKIIPNITISQLTGSVSTAAVFIRGIGNIESSVVSEQGVGIYLNGVYIARSSASVFDTSDIDRIEVLRGPQGTLFGRNSVGGAIQIVSDKPKDDLSARISSGYGKNNDWRAGLRLDTGKIGNFSAYVSYNHHQRNGYVNNLLTISSRDPGWLNSDSLITYVKGEFSKVSVDYIFDYDNRHGQSSLAQIVAATPDVFNYFSRSQSLGGDPFLFGPGRRSVGLQSGSVDENGNYQTASDSTVYGHTLTVSYEPSGNLTLKSITGYRHWKQHQTVNVSGNGFLKGVVLNPEDGSTSIEHVDLYNNSERAGQHQFSQELQALGNIGNLKYVGGLFYFDESAYEITPQFITVVLPGGDVGLNVTPLQSYSGTTKSYAAFGQLGWKPPSLEGKLEITGGARYTHDKKTILLSGDVPDLRGSTGSSNLSWLLSASYKVTPDIMGYVRVSTGYRAGGMSARVAFINKYKPEKAIAYEAGIKSSFFDNKLTANLTGFYTKYSDLQVNQFHADASGNTTIVVNAGKVDYRGLEAELIAAPTSHILINGSIGYTDPKYITYLYTDPLTGVQINVADEIHMVQASKINTHVAVSYIIPTKIGDVTARVDFSYRGTVYYNPLDRIATFNEKIKSPGDYNLRARIQIDDVRMPGGWKGSFGIWGDNLTNDTNIDYGVDFGALGFGLVTYKRPISFGVDATIKF